MYLLGLFMVSAATQIVCVAAGVYLGIRLWMHWERGI